MERLRSTIRHCRTTVGQNTQLLLEVTDFEFTSGRCLVSDENSAFYIPVRQNIPYDSDANVCLSYDRVLRPELLWAISEENSKRCISVWTNAIHANSFRLLFPRVHKTLQTWIVLPPLCPLHLSCFPPVFPFLVSWTDTLSDFWDSGSLFGSCLDLPSLMWWQVCYTR